MDVPMMEAISLEAVEVQPDHTGARKDRPMKPLDEQLILKTAQEDMDAFAQLYDQASAAVYTYALSILHDKDDAEDVVQDTFLKIRSAAHLYRPQGKPMAWILTIARNLCMMRFRNRSRITVLDQADPMPDWGHVPSFEDRETLKTAFSVLAEDETQIILLHVVAGLKHRETAQLLQMHLSTVLSKYNRGIHKLRRELERGAQ